MKRTMEVANLVCTSAFGDELLDIMDKLFYPALKNCKVKASRSSETHYYVFNNVNFEKVDGEWVLYGRLIKRQELKAHQHYDEVSEKLVPTTDSLLSDPSSFFVLLLKNHRLLWVKEFPRSPELKDLKYTLNKALKEFRVNIISSALRTKALDYKKEFDLLIKAPDKSTIKKREVVSDNELATHKSIISRDAKTFINEISKNQIKDGLKSHYIRLLKDFERDLYIKYPQLDITITPLNNKIDIAKEFETLSRITNVKIKAIKRNQDLRHKFNTALSSLGGLQEDTNAKDITAEIKGEKRNPLKKESIKEIITNATDGNYEFEFIAYNNDDQVIRGNSKDFSLKLDTIFDSTGSIITNVKNMIDVFVKTVNKYSYLIPLSPQEDKLAEEKIIQINKSISDNENKE